MLTNVLNPKVAVFFVAFLPQFLPTGGSAAAGTLMLAAVFIAMTAGYLLGLVAVTVRAARPPGGTAVDGPSGRGGVRRVRRAAGTATALNRT